MNNWKERFDINFFLLMSWTELSSTIQPKYIYVISIILNEKWKARCKPLKLSNIIFFVKRRLYSRICTSKTYNEIVFKFYVVSGSVVHMVKAFMLLFFDVMKLFRHFIPNGKENKILFIQSSSLCRTENIYIDSMRFLGWERQYLLFCKVVTI